MGKELLILDFKLVTEPSGAKKVYLLEAGLAMVATLPQEVDEAVYQEFKRLYPGKTIFIGTPNFIDGESDSTFQYVPSLYEDLLAGTHQKSGLIFFADSFKTRHVDAHVRKNNWAHLEVMNPNSMLYATDKSIFAALCAQNQLPIPDTWLCSPYSMNKERLEKIKLACPEGVIIKPARGTCGRGVAFVEVADLDAVVAWMHGESSYNPLADIGRFMEHWEQEKLGTISYIIQRCIITAKTGLEPTYRVVFSANEGEINVLGMLEKYSFDAASSDAKRNSASIVSCTTAAAEKYHLQEKKARILENGSDEYANISTLMLPVIQKLVNITPALDPVKLCIDEYKKNRSEKSDYIYHVLHQMAHCDYKPFDDSHVAILKECIIEQRANNPRNIDALFNILLSGYFRKEPGYALPAYARTENFFQFIAMILTRTKAKYIHDAVKECAEFCLQHDTDFVDIRDRMNGETRTRMEAILSALESMRESKPYPRIPCLFGPYSHYFLFDPMGLNEKKAIGKNPSSLKI